MKVHISQVPLWVPFKPLNSPHGWFVCKCGLLINDGTRFRVIKDPMEGCASSLHNANYYGSSFDVNAYVELDPLVEELCADT